jgi:hypothetical protein
MQEGRANGRRLFLNRKLNKFRFISPFSTNVDSLLNYLLIKGEEIAILEGFAFFFFYFTKNISYEA